MSGIAGILQLDGQPASPQALCGMSAALAHRGPDASGAVTDGVVGLAHRLLWSTPESTRETQPLVHRTGNWILVADARLDNRDDLCPALGLSRGAEVSDGELILRAYEKWGARCPEHLLGDFAFVVWDRHARKLFCARDAMGVKPFYYFHSGRVFAFASEVKALFALPEVPRQIDPEQVALYLEGTIDDRERTLYEGIYRLPAAHTMEVDLHRVRRSQYWTLDATRELRLGNDEEYAQRFREIFQDAVGVRIRSAYPVGAALSGGLDSSAIVCMARHIQGAAGTSSGLQTFSLVFPSLPDRELKLIDERSYMDSVVRGGGLRPHFIRGDELTPLADLPVALRHLDEPYPAPNLYLHWAMYRAAHDRGARVFLDGFDGDTTVSHGLGRLGMLVSSGRWDAFEAEVRALSARREMHPAFVLPHYGLPYLESLARSGRWLAWARAARELTTRFDVPRRAALIDRGLLPLIPSPLLAAYRTVRGRTAEVSSLVAPNLARQLRARAREQDHDCAFTKGPQATERESHLEGLSQPVYQLMLEVADKSAAAFDLEPRYPFFDRRLIEFCLALPAEQKLSGGWPRVVFRRAMEGILPPEIQWRSNKGNLSPNFHRTLRAVSATALDAAAVDRLAAYIDVDALRAMQERYGAGGTRTDDGHVLFRTIVLARWLSEFSKETQTEPLRTNPLAPAAA
jgi:asparagine synthase (glutamine-hydrolysing)